MSFHKYTDGVDTASVSCLPESGNFKSPGDFFIYKQNPFAYTSNVVVVKAGCAIDLYTSGVWEQFVNRADQELTVADLDTGTFVVGLDYYIYLCWTGSVVSLKISANTTYPSVTGITADNSRKIGGFHYGHIRKVSADGEWTPVDGAGGRFGSTTTIWQQNVTVGIVPNSVWDLKNRPRCSPDGMVKVGNLWVDIYLSSAAETVTFEGATNGLFVAYGKLQSKYGQYPVTGTEGLNWYSFTDLAQRSGKRMLSYAEWIRGAYGNPGGEAAADNYGWTKTANSARTRTGAKVNVTTGVFDSTSGIKPYAISALNLVDCVGNVYEWLDELGPRVSTDDTLGAFAWRNNLGADKGQAYLASASGLAAFVAGGHWGVGVNAGSRAVILDNCPWSVGAYVGCRLACDAA